MIKLFVYGTLANREPTHRLPGYMMFKVRGQSFNFPVIQPYPWQDQLPNIMGSIREVTEEELAQLDVYEGVSRGLYKRTKAFAIPLSANISEMEEVQVYVGGPALVHEPIPSGYWNE